MAKIALGTWAWGAGAFGGYAVFGSKTDVENPLPAESDRGKKYNPVLEQLSALTEEISDWMEYCNLSVGKWGRMRMANGHTEPYNVNCTFHYIPGN